MFGFYISDIYVYGFILAVVLVAAIYALLYRTRFGRSVRATMQDQTAARLVGIDVNRVAALTFGDRRRGDRGRRHGLRRHQRGFNPNSGYDLISRLLAIIILGGLGSIGGALAAAVFMITVESLVDIWSPELGHRGLLRRPGASCWRSARRACSAGRRCGPSEPAATQPAGPRLAVRVRPHLGQPQHAAGLGWPGACCWPCSPSSRWCSPTRSPPTTAFYALIFVAAAAAWNIFSGYSGYISLGHAVFFGSGAYTVGIARQRLELTGDAVFALLPLAAAGRRRRSRCRSAWSRCGSGGTRSS